MSKYDRLINLSIQVIRQDVLKGHLKWKVTELSKVSRVARSRIYELLGKNKKEILETSIKLILDELYAVSPERKAYNEKHGKWAGLLKSRDLVLSNPELIIFSYKNRHRQDMVGELLLDAERKYLKKLSSEMGIKNKRKLLFVRTFIHGMSQSPFLEVGDLEELLLELDEHISKLAP